MLDIMELDPATFNLINKISYEEASRASSADVEEELEDAMTQNNQNGDKINFEIKEENK